jgi:hypothetical protein
MLDNLYIDHPDDLEQAAGQAARFLNAGKDSEEDGEEQESPLRLYSFTRDADFIFAAFRQTHGIDLEKENPHWWKFMALFMDLGADTTFCNLVNLRKRLKNGKASKDEREAARELGALADVPDMIEGTLEERIREQEFMKMVEKGQQ